MADSGRPGDTPLTPEQSRQLNEQLVEKAAQDEADKQKEQLEGTMVGALPVMMGYDPYEPPPPPPPPPQPPTDTSTAPDDYDPTWGTDDDEEEPSEDVIPIHGDSSNAQDQIYADPGLGERGDPPPPPPPPLDPTDPANATFIGAKGDVDPIENATFAPVGANASTPAPTGVSPMVIVGALVGVLLLGAVGFAATRPSEPSAAPAPAFTPPTAPTAPPTIAATVPPPAAAAARVKQLTFATPADGTSVCLQPVSFNLSVTLENAKAGDTVHVALTGPGMPAAGVTGTVDGSLTFATKVGPVGPVKGQNTWSATVDTINGKPTAGVSATPIAFCPTN